MHFYVRLVDVKHEGESDAGWGKGKGQGGGGACMNMPPIIPRLILHVSTILKSCHLLSSRFWQSCRLVFYQLEYVSGFGCGVREVPKDLNAYLSQQFSKYHIPCPQIHRRTLAPPGFISMLIFSPQLSFKTLRVHRPSLLPICSASNSSYAHRTPSTLAFYNPLPIPHNQW